MDTVLMTLSGLFWAVTYLLIIQKSWQDKTYGMPALALAANFAWEFIFSFVFPHGYPQRTVNIIWFLLDLVLIFQFITFGPREFKTASKSVFYTLFVGMLILSFSIILLITREFNDLTGAYSAFGQNLMMSGLFIHMALTRNSLRGQSIYIAITKLLGTASASLWFLVYFHKPGYSGLLPALYLGIFVLDLLYILQVHQLKHRLSL